MIQPPIKRSTIWFMNQPSAQKIPRTNNSLQRRNKQHRLFRVQLVQCQSSEWLGFQRSLKSATRTATDIQIASTCHHIFETCRTQQLWITIREIKGMTTQKTPTPSNTTMRLRSGSHNQIKGTRDSWGTMYESDRQHSNRITIRPLPVTNKQQAKWPFLAKTEPDRTNELKTATVNEPP